MAWVLLLANLPKLQGAKAPATIQTLKAETFCVPAAFCHSIEALYRYDIMPASVTFQ